jgi:hypothetical protein
VTCQLTCDFPTRPSCSNIAFTLVTQGLQVKSPVGVEKVTEISG